MFSGCARFASVGRSSTQTGGPAVRALRVVMSRTGILRYVPTVTAAMERADPALRIALRRLPAAPPLALVSVYRHRNRATVAGLLASLPPGSPVALWALDEVADELRDRTCGCGPGARFALLNRCLRALDVREDAWLVVSDDDVEFCRGDLQSAARIARAAGLDLVQPAHAWSSNWNWRYTRRRWLGIARRGRFVEIGPLFLLSPRGRRLVLPLPEDVGMGWGIEAQWASLESRGLRLGVVDAVHMRHLIPGGMSYDRSAEYERELTLRQRFGVAELTDLQRDAARWTLLNHPIRGRGDY